MATQQFEGVTSLPAAADFRALTPKGYRFVVRNSSGQAALLGAGAPNAYGVMDGDQVNVGEQTRIIKMQGRAQLKLDVGGTVAAEAEITSDATGRMVAAVAGNTVYGTADEAAVLNQVASFSPRVPYVKA